MIIKTWKCKRAFRENSNSFSARKKDRDND